VRFDTAAVIIFNPDDATGIIADAITRGTGVVEPVVYDLAYDQRQDKTPVKDGVREDIIILCLRAGCGTVPAAAQESFRRLSGYGQPAILAGTYGCTGIGTALREIDALARQLGFTPIAAGAFPVREKAASADPRDRARPDELDLFKARELGFDVRFLLERRQWPVKTNLVLPKRIGLPFRCTGNDAKPITAQKTSLKSLTLQIINRREPSLETVLAL
jgi:hypothetical protein